MLKILKYGKGLEKRVIFAKNKIMELKGKENKDCKIFIEEIEPAAIKTIYNLLDSPAFKDKSIRRGVF